MESGNDVHVKDENGVKNVETNEDEEAIESSKLEVSESSEDVNATKLPNSVEVNTNLGTSKNNNVTKNGPKGGLSGRKPKPNLTQSLSFPAKPRNHESMRSSMDGHPGKPRATLSKANVINPANKRASTGAKTKETGSNNGGASARRATMDSVPSVHVSRPRKSNGSEDAPASADPLLRPMGSIRTVYWASLLGWKSVLKSEKSSSRR